MIKYLFLSKTKVQANVFMLNKDHKFKNKL